MKFVLQNSEILSAQWLSYVGSFHFVIMSVLTLSSVIYKIIRNWSSSLFSLYGSYESTKWRLLSHCICCDCPSLKFHINSLFILPEEYQLIMNILCCTLSLLHFLAELWTIYWILLLLISCFVSDTFEKKNNATCNV